MWFGAQSMKKWHSTVFFTSLLSLYAAYSTMCRLASPFVPTHALMCRLYMLYLMNTIWILISVPSILWLCAYIEDVSNVSDALIHLDCTSIYMEEVHMSQVSSCEKCVPLKQTQSAHCKGQEKKCHVRLLVKWRSVTPRPVRELCVWWHHWIRSNCLVWTRGGKRKRD